MPKTTLTERYRAYHALSTFRRLNELDDMWTDHVGEPATASGEELQTLQLVATDMDDLLARCVEDAAFVEAFIDKYGSSLNAEINGVVQQCTDRCRARLEAQGGLLSFARLALRTIREGADKERQEIAVKMQRLIDGGYAMGDFSTGFKCALWAISCAGAVLFAAAGAGMTAPAAVGACAAAVTQMGNLGC